MSKVLYVSYEKEQPRHVSRYDYDADGYGYSDQYGCGRSGDLFGGGFGGDWVVGDGWGCGYTFDGNGHGSDYTYTSFDGQEPEEGDGSGGYPDGEEGMSLF